MTLSNECKVYETKPICPEYERKELERPIEFVILNKLTVKGILEGKKYSDNNVLVVNTDLQKREDLENLRKEIMNKLDS